MSQSMTPKETSQLFKDVFLSKRGLLVLEKIQSFCGGNAQQVLACPESTNQTFFNLGANAVYRYIQRQINMPFNDTDDDCVIEIENES
jgi:hypothetical protein